MKTSCAVTNPSDATVRAGWLLALVLAVATVVTVSPAYGRDPALVNVTVQENTPDCVLLRYELGNFAGEAAKIDGREYARIKLGKEGLMLVQGAPELPHVCRSIIIPENAEMQVRVVAADFREVEGVDLAPSKGVLSRTVDPDDVPYTFGPEYATDEFYPGELATLGEPYILRDYRGVVVELKPLQYNPATRTLRFYERVTLEVVQIGPGRVNVLTPRPESGEMSLAFHNIYQTQFLNYDPGPRSPPLDETGDMLILCYDSWLSNVAPLVAHKNSIGISTTAVGVSTIPGGNTSTAIKNYIQSLYDTSNLAFVLLVGDAAQVATPTSAGGSSDPTYSKLAGTDNYPDIMVGRFSAESEADVDTQVQRTIEYENLPATQQAWFWKGTGIGSQYGIGDDGEYDYQHIDNLRLLLLAHGYILIDQINGASATAAQVSTALNAGRGIINYCGHGSSMGWSTTGFSGTHVAALTNDNMLPFIFSVACLNGRFSGYTCFAEAWLRSTHNGEPIGAIGAYMSSIDQDWNPPMQAQDEFAALYAAATPAYNCFGTLCYAASCSMMDEYGATSGSSGANMFLTWHVFGDPSLRITGPAEVTHGMKVSPPYGLTASGPLGGPFTPGSVAYILENKNTTPIDYNVTASQSWISISNESGTIAGRGSTTVTVAVNSYANTLGEGSYSNTINFVNTTDHDGDVTRSVSLTVGGAAWDPVSYDVNASTTISAAEDVTLNAIDPNGDPLTYVLESLPASGFLSDPGAGPIQSVPYQLVGGGKVVTYQPPCGEVVVDSFTYTAKDLTAKSNVATVTVSVALGTAQSVYNFPLDSNPGWSTQGLWAFGRPAGGGSHDQDPNYGHTGINVYGHNLFGDYTNNLVVQYLTTTAIDCTNLTSTELRFWRWLGVEGYSGSGVGDQAGIQVSNNGSDWTMVWKNGSVAVSDATWSLQTYNISAAADQHATVYVRWSLGPTDRGVTYPGWNIDDVEIWGVAAWIPVEAGDVNLDGTVNGADIGPFVEMLLDPASATTRERCAADMEENGIIDLGDLDVFVQRLLQP